MSLNRPDYDFVGLYAAILKDVAAYFPNDQLEWDRDLSRITLLKSSRGLPVFTMDLPAIGKALDASLSSGRLCLDNLNHTRFKRKGSAIPRLFWGLWSRIFNDDGCLRSDIDPNAVLFLRTLLYTGKNLKLECATKYRIAAVKEWFDVEAHLPPSDPYWGQEDDDDRFGCSLGSLSDYLLQPGGSLDLFPSGNGPGEDSLLDDVQYVCDVISGNLGSFDPEVFRLRHGPGAVSDVSKGSYKFSFPNWNPRLEAVCPYDRFGTVASSALGVDPDTGYDVTFNEPHSELHAVPKTQKGPRLIASEPACNQWIQQGARDVLYTRIRERSSILGKSIDFRSQSPSRDGALSASRTGDFATIDLKSASDRLSTGVVQRVFRRNKELLDILRATRTRFLRVDAKVGSEWKRTLHRVRKFATQGSALTFPIQSMVFAAVCLGVGYHRSHLESIRLGRDRFWCRHPEQRLLALARKVRVFGDDIIVPTEWEPQVQQVLHLLGLRVNQAKTHTTGNFRESCGMDAFQGHDVTPAYVTRAADKTDPRSIASVVATTNNFFMKGLWTASVWLESTATMRNLRTVGVRSGVFGFKSFCGSPSYPRKWNEGLQRLEVEALQIFAKSTAIQPNTAPRLLQFFTEFDTRSDSNWRDSLYPRMDYVGGVPVAGVPVIRHTRVAIEDLV